MSLKTYQWIKGERAGEVVKSDGETILDGTIAYLVFTDGSRCNSNLLGDYIMEIASDHPSDLLLLNELAPQPLKKVEAPKPQPETKQSIAPQTSPTMSPLDSLLSTAKKVKQDVPINITVEVPPAELLKVVAASFDNGEKFIEEYLVKSWTKEQLQEIQKQIAQYIMAGVFEKPKTKKKNEKSQDAARV